MQSHEEERRPLLSDRQHGGFILQIFVCCTHFQPQISIPFHKIPTHTLIPYSHQGSVFQYILQNTFFCVVVCLQYECQYCQYHVKAQYKKMSSKRADLQSSFSGKAPNKLKGKGSNLRERLCQDGFYYGGISSAACAVSL